MISLVVFDWNGTLLADASAVVEATKHVLALYNLPPVTIKQYREVYKTPIMLMQKSLGIDEAEYKKNHIASNQVFHDFYEPRVARCRTRSGTRQTLLNLQKLGIQQVILSNHTIEGIYLQLERLNLSAYIKTILANDDIVTSHFVGKQGRLKEYLETEKIPPDEVVIIGDTLEEIAIARHLKLHSVAITGGYVSEKRLKEAKPDKLIHKLADLMPAIKELS